MFHVKVNSIYSAEYDISHAASFLVTSYGQPPPPRFRSFVSAIIILVGAAVNDAKSHTFKPGFLLESYH